MEGRYNERALFDKLAKDKVSHFVAVYGRRRVGKTYLIRNHFQGRFCFTHTGLANAETTDQLAAFHRSIISFSKLKYPVPNDWYEAFENLKKLILHSKQTKKILFIDELPWMDTPRSKFLSALEHFWNSWASARKDILFIICGSATSYIVHKIFGNKGGLHNRVTQKIKLNPFTLKETKAFLLSKKIDWSDYQIVKAYMSTGGIPFYLDAMERGKSPEQMIDKLFFNKNGLLYNEFYHLYASLFKNEDKYIAVIKALATKSKGLTRDEISQLTKLSNGGSLTRILTELELSDFIVKYNSYGKNTRNTLYQLTDFFSLFYLKFIANKNTKSGDWVNAIDNPKYRAWSGYAFEQVCMTHVPQIKHAMGISGVQTTEWAWRSTQSTNGAQIDLVIDRKDHITHIFEMKFSINEFTIDKKYDAELRNKIGCFKKETKTKNAIWLVMMTTYGLKENEYAYLAQHNLTMMDLFKI